MIGKNFFEEDVALKRSITTPRDQKPSYDWSDLCELEEDEKVASERIEVEIGDERQMFNVSRVAETVGGALTDLLLSRKEKDIYTDRNRKLVAMVSSAVTRDLISSAEERKSLSNGEIIEMIERALIRNNAHDIAKSLVIRRHVELIEQIEREKEANLPTDEQTLVRVIRRNGHVVAWNENKVEIAVRKAFLSLHLDSDPATAIAGGVARRMREEGQKFMHIEDVQDKVQEELMKQGHFKVAEAYILYRAHRSQLRDVEQGAILLEEAENAPPLETQESMILVKETDGNSYFWDGKDLKKRIEFGMMGLDLCLNAGEIEMELRRSIFQEMTVADLQTTIILNARSLIERDADFTKFAARILLSYIYEEVLDWDIVKDGVEKLAAKHRSAFIKNIRRGIEIGRLSPKLQEYDLGKLAQALDPAADLDFDYLGIQTLYDRYLIIDKKNGPARRLETPQLFWMRVAMGLFVGEKKNRGQQVFALYKLYKGRRFCSSTPTLFNSGTMHSQLSSCYLYKVDDSIESIMHRGIAENAFLSKWAGGLGGSWTAVRGTGSYIQGTNGESQGVIPFLKLHNDQLVAVNQGGKRRGSGCAYLETWHTDIQDFLELRKNTGDERRRTHDMNTANWIPDLFMKRMEAREKWTLFRSNEAPDLHDLYGKAFETRYLEYEEKVKNGEIHGKEVPAIDLWKSMLRMVFETGHPWITFKDPCNVRSPQDHAGVIHSSNLCTEITLNTGPDETAVCNLGSIVLDNHLDGDGEIDHKKLRDTVRTAVRALDNVIDINFYPTTPAETSNKRHRPIGLGVMGLQNALYRRNTPFASREAVDFNDEFMEAISYYAFEASSDLAKERGSYSSFEGSKWDRGLLPIDTIDMLEEQRGEKIDVPRGGKMDWDKLRAKIKKQGMRNSNVLAIAPTATISNIMGSTPCIEPTYKNIFAKSNLSGDFLVLNRFLVRDLKERGLWTKEIGDSLKYHDGDLAKMNEIPGDLKKKYQTAFDIEFKYFIDAAARRQKWIDQSQSVNLFLALPDLKTLSHMYRAAWRAGLKTTYYLRTLGASNIEKATIQVRKEMRGVNNDGLADANGSGEAPKKEYTEAEVQACSLEAMVDGGECEACQ